MAIIRRTRSTNGCPRNSAAPNSVTMISASLRAVVVGTREPRDDTAELAVASRRRHRDYGSPAGGELCAAHEIALPANRANIHARRHFSVDLTR